jgi:Mismatch repair ATPase (MutS family)
VASLAGLPEALISRARALLSLLEEQSSTDLAGIDLSRADTHVENRSTEQEEHMLSALRALDVNSLTPLEALSLLNDFRQKDLV